MVRASSAKGKAGLAGGAVAAALLIATPFIASWEGKRNDPYDDIVRVRTVCYGHTGPDIQARRYTDAECQQILRDDIGKHLGPVIDCTPQIADKPRVLASAASLAFNIGSSAYCKSTVAARFRAGRIAEGCNGYMAWVYAGGKRVQGLVNRRAAERDLCLSGLK